MTSKNQTKNKKRPGTKKSRATAKSLKRRYEITLVLLLSFTVISILSLHTESVGILGKLIRSLTLGFFGRGGMVFPYVLFLIIFLKINKNFKEVQIRYTAGLAAIFFALALALAIDDFNQIRDSYLSSGAGYFNLDFFKASYSAGVALTGAGVIFNTLALFLYSTMGKYGLLIVTMAFAMIGLLLVVNYRVTYEGLKGLKRKTRTPTKALSQKKRPADVSEPVTREETPVTPKPPKDIKIFSYNDFNPRNQDPEEGKSEQEILQELNKNVTSKITNYVKPRSSMLIKPKIISDSLDKSEILKNAEHLEKTLGNFGIRGKVMEISRGPTITRYELQPEAGIKLSKIIALADDLALNMAVSQVRIAPVPGKVAVGIEIPNEENSMVQIREILESDAFKSSKSKLTMALGKNISGKPVVFDLGDMPHLLIAGATGSGKSVCVNTIITSLLFNATPDEVKLLMIDPKVVELNVYNGIPHLILPVVTNPKKASIALGWAVNEMNRRYESFAQQQVKDIDGYNRKNPQAALPKIVVIIDELADLMMVAPNQVEDAIARLAQMARAAGIHLIVATQRPSVDVITGLIKANITSRIAFSVSSQVDSRTILDSAGAEKLLGKGDMLFSPVGAQKPLRLQGAFISEEEIDKIVTHIKKQAGEVVYNHEILDETQQMQMAMDSDDLIPEIIRFLVNQKTISVSMLQRKFRIGYNRAARIMDELEEKSIVGPNTGSKPRDVIMTIEEMEKYL